MIKSNCRRILALLMALLAAFSLSTGALAAEGEAPVYEYTDAYVINYAQVDYGGYEAQLPYLYYSPHRGSMGIRNLQTGKMEYWNTGHKVYNLINTTKLSQGGEGAYASIGAYCVDACIDAVSGVTYRRINLEDSGYFTDTTAGRLRAIYLNAFPYIKDMSVIEKRVNEWLSQTQSEYAPVSGLTCAEVISATQYTIWEVANGTDVEGGTPYDETKDYTLEELSQNVVYPQDQYVDSTEGARDTTANNIQMLNQYLLALEPVGPSQIAVSDVSFASQSMTVQKQGDGKFTVTVDVQIQATVSQSDALVLSAAMGQQVQTVQLTPGQTNYRLTLVDAAAVETVKLEINGTQTAADVFLFDAGGERESSQSMIAYDDSALPVHAETELQPRILNFYKTTVVDNGDGTTSRIPLEGIVFDIYAVMDMDSFTSGKVALPEAPTVEYARENYTLVASVSTGSDGKAVYNLTAEGMADGVYLVAEQKNPAIVEPAAPFFVCVPMTNEQGDGWVYSIDIQPKNQVVEGPQIRKDVTEIDQEEDTFAVGQTHTWIIRADVPADIAGGKAYTITDTLDYRLTYKGNVAVKVGLTADKANTEAVTLTLGKDYVLKAVEITDDQQRRVDQFTLSLTQAGMQAVAAAVGAGSYGDFEVRVYFDAVIDSDAAMDERIPNQAALEYTNSVGFDYDAVSDLPEVYTGGLQILKYDAKDDTKFLAGASFRLARAATQTEINAGLAQTLVVGGQESYVVFVEFYTDTALTARADQVTTLEDGRVLLCGLAYGTYYLVETKAPAGYNLLSNPVTVTVGTDSYTEDYAVRVANSSEPVLPATGGIGTLVFTITGLVLIGAAGALLVFSRKKRLS